MASEETETMPTETTQLERQTSESRQTSLYEFFNIKKGDRFRDLSIDTPLPPIVRVALKGIFKEEFVKKVLEGTKDNVEAEKFLNKILESEESRKIFEKTGGKGKLTANKLRSSLRSNGIRKRMAMVELIADTKFKDQISFGDIQMPRKEKQQKELSTLSRGLKIKGVPVDDEDDEDDEEQSGATQAGEARTTERTERTDGKKLTVIVEDIKMNSRMMERKAKNQNRDVVVLKNLDEVQKWKEDNPDKEIDELFLDYNFPTEEGGSVEKNGVKAYDILKNQTTNVYVSSDDSDAQTAFEGIEVERFMDTTQTKGQFIGEILTLTEPAEETKGGEQETFTTGAEGEGLDDERNRRVDVDGTEMPLTQEATPTDNATGDATGVLENRTPNEGQGQRPREEEALGAGIEQTEGGAVAMAGAGAGEDTPVGGIEQTTEEGVADLLEDAIEEQPEFMEDLQREAQAVEAVEAQAQAEAQAEAQAQQAPMEEGETFESVSPQPSAIDLITASGLLSKPKYHGRLIQNARELVGQHDHLKGLKADDLSKLDNKELHELIVLNVKLYGRKIGVKKVFTKPSSKRADLEQEYHEVSMLIHFWYSTKLGVGTNQPRVGMLLPQSAIAGLSPLLQQLGQLTGGMGGMGQPQEHPAHTQHLTPKQQLQRNLAQSTGQPLVEQTPTQPREIPREMDRPRNRPFDLSSRYGVKDRVRRNIMNRAGMSEGLALNFG